MSVIWIIYNENIKETTLEKWYKKIFKMELVSHWYILRLKFAYNTTEYPSMGVKDICDTIYENLRTTGMLVGKTGSEVRRSLNLRDVINEQPLMRYNELMRI